MNQASAHTMISLIRKPHALFCALFFLVFSLLGSSGSDDRGALTPAEVYTAFDTAIKTKNLRAFMKVCNKPLANFSPGPSCGTLLNEAWLMGRTYTKVSESAGTAPAKKAVIELKSTGPDKSEQPLFFLLELAENNRWVLKNINNNRNYAATYLK